LFFYIYGSVNTELHKLMTDRQQQQQEEEDGRYNLQVIRDDFSRCEQHQVTYLMLFVVSQPRTRTFSK